MNRRMIDALGLLVAAGYAIDTVAQHPLTGVWSIVGFDGDGRFAKRAEVDDAGSITVFRQDGVLVGSITLDAFEKMFEESEETAQV